MKRIVRLGVILLIVMATAFFVFAPGIAERGMNQVKTPTAPTSERASTQRNELTLVDPHINQVKGTAAKISPRGLALHKTLGIADLHSDTLLWQRNMLDAAQQGHVDVPRLQAGNVALQVFSSVTKTPKGQNYNSNGSDTDNITMLVIGQLQPAQTWNSLIERSLWHANKLHRAQRASGGAVRIVRSQAGLAQLLADRADNARRAIIRPDFATSYRAPAPIGALLSVEGLHNLEGKRANLDRLYDAGFRMAGIAHFFDNELGGSMHGIRKGGLTPFGRTVISDMEARGMIVDIAHSSHAAVAEILSIAKRPVVSSHGGVQATCKVNRNLTDDEIKGVAATGGVIGIGYWEGAVCDTSPASIARAIMHVRNLVGIDHVGLGSDFDGSVTTAFDTSQLALVTQALIDAGLSDGDIAKVMGGNVLRILAQGLPPR